MSRFIIQNGHLIDPKNHRDGLFDIFVENGVVRDVVRSGQRFENAEILEAGGCIVAPGFIDLHTHLREPGFEYKETIQSGTHAASKGGFTSICCMANTLPVNDNASVTLDILKQAKETGFVNVYPIGAVTVGLKGEMLSPMGELKKAGCVAFSDDGNPVANSMMMRLAMEYAKSFDLPIVTHAIDPLLQGDGVMNEGFESMRLGLPGIPSQAEEIMIARDIYLAQLTGAKLHVAHISTAEGVNLVRRAKEEGLAVSAEVTPHHLFLTDKAIGHYDTHAKMMPPLRTLSDVSALIQGLKEGVIDAIATDHAPHGIIDKEVEFSKAECGVIGLETALSVSLQLAEKHDVPLTRIIEALTMNPAKIFGLKKGFLEKGADADIVIFDPQKEYTVDSHNFLSKSRNTPFNGMTFRGVVKYTMVGGKVVYRGSTK